MPARTVYRRPSRSVKPHRPGDRAGRVLAWLPAGLLWTAVSTGCATTGPVVDTAAKAVYPIAVRYDVEPVLVEHGREDAFETMRRDMESVTQMGFEAVMLRQLDEPERAAVVGLAREKGLRVWLPERWVQHFLLTGTERPAVAQTRAHLRDGEVMPIADATGNPAHGQRHLMVGTGMPVVGVLPTSGCLAPFVSIDIRKGSPEAPVVERILTQFHEGVAIGQTGGLVVNRFRRPPGSGGGLAGASERLDPALVAAVKTLIARARRWGPRLHGATVEPVLNASAATSDLGVTLLTRGHGRCLLVFNRSPERFARSPIMLPETVGGEPALRAVEIPSSPNTPVGRVYEAQRGRLSLPVSLRPGDAVLFELFSAPSARR